MKNTIRFFLCCITVFVTSDFFSQDAQSEQSNSYEKRYLSSTDDHEKVNILLSWDKKIQKIDSELDLFLMKKIDSICTVNLKKKTKDRIFYQNNKAIAQNVIGIFALNRSDWGVATENFHSSLKIMQKLQDFEGIANALQNLGQLHHSQRKYDRAIDYFSKALRYFKKINNEQKVANALNNIAVALYSKENRYSDKSYQFLKESFRLRKKLKLNLGIATSLNNLGNYHFEKKEFKTAERMYLESMQISDSLKFTLGSSNSRFNLAKYYNNEGAKLKAEEFAKMSLELALKGKLVAEIVQSSKLLAQIYESQGEIRDALESYKQYYKYKFILENNDFNNKILENEFSHQFREKKMELQLENSRKSQIRKLESRDQWIVVIIVFLMALIISLFLYSSIRNGKTILEQKTLVEKKNKELKASINCASRIQKTILPSLTKMDSIVENSFVLFSPKEKVGGDFYWFEKKNDWSYIAVADCTGHGVPGALVSMVCYEALNKTLNQFKLTSPNEILDSTSGIVERAFSNEEKRIRDGMDISILGIHEGKYFFSGANNSVWIITDKNDLTEAQLNLSITEIGENKVLYEVKGDRQPIGYYEHSEDFNLVELKLKKDDVIYIMTDGFRDQFGGEFDKKMKSKFLKRYLLKIQEAPFLEHEAKLSELFQTWKGTREQTDDVCIVGIKVN